MGSDLFESYVGSIISAVTLAAVAVNSAPETATFSESDAAIFPLIISAIGIIASVIGILLVRGKEGGNPASAFKYGTYISGVIVIIALLLYSSKMFFGGFEQAIAIIVLVWIIGAVGRDLPHLWRLPSLLKIAEQSGDRCCHDHQRSCRWYVMSTAIPILRICVGIFTAFKFAGLYGIALAAVGMSTTGMTVAVDAYGPIRITPAQVAEMSGVGTRS